jgi:Bacterial alpha-L-rhamnosidase.
MEFFKNAEWIWRDDAQTKNIYLNFFENFKGEENKNYTLYISADTDYAVYLNGAFVPAKQFRDYTFEKVYDKIELNAGVTVGKNLLRIVGYCQNNDSSTYRTVEPGKPSGAIIYSLWNSESEVLSSSADTAVCINYAYSGEGVDVVTGQLGYTFKYDATKENDRSGICTADVIKKSKGLYPRPIKPLVWEKPKPKTICGYGRFSEKQSDIKTIGAQMQYADLEFTGIPAQTVLPAGEGIAIKKADGYDGSYIILDLGKESVGAFYLDISLECEAKILIGWGEHLDDGHVRAYVGGRNFCAEYRATKGRNRFMHPFLRMGCRYIQLHIYSADAVLFDAGVIPTEYPLNLIPYNCGNNTDQKIYDTSVHTLVCCMHEHYEDCPWREQALYTMDSRNQMLCGYYAFGEYAFPKASLRLMAQSLRDDNQLELCSPARVPITIPSFTAIFPPQLYEYAVYSKDTALLLELLPTVEKIADGFIAHTDESGLIPCYGESIYWNFYEWQDGLAGVIGGYVPQDQLTYDAPLQCFVSMCLDAVAKSLRLFDKEDAAEKYIAARDAINAKTNELFWNSDENIYFTYRNKNDGTLYHTCELTQSLALYCGACPEDRADTVRQTLAADKLLAISLSYSIFKYDALLADPQYRDYVAEKIHRVWGNMLDRGATTFWETEKGADDFGNAGSLCHGWSAIPIYMYHKYNLLNK